MQFTTKLDNASIFSLAEKRMVGIVYIWWQGPSQAEREEVIKEGLPVFEQLLRTQLCIEAEDSKK